MKKKVEAPVVLPFNQADVCSFTFPFIIIKASVWLLPLVKWLCGVLSVFITKVEAPLWFSPFPDLLCAALSLSLSQLR